MHRTSPLRALAAAALLGALAALPNAAAAQPVGPTYPPPGGVTFNGTGSAIGQGGSPGRLNQYSGFNTTGLSQLFWALGSPIANPRLSTQASTGQMVFAGVDGNGVATWNSSANLTYASASGTQSYATRLRLQFQPNDGINTGPRLTGWLAPTTASAAGITSLPANWPVFAVKNGAAPATPFQVWYRFETASGTPLGPAYDASHATVAPGTQLVTSVSGGFYATTTPEPATLALLGGGLALVAVGARRRRAG